MTPTKKTCEYWLEVVLHWAETRLSGPQYDECVASLTTTARAELAKADAERLAEAIVRVIESYHLDGTKTPSTYGRPSITYAWQEVQAALAAHDAARKDSAE